MSEALKGRIPFTNLGPLQDKMPFGQGICLATGNVGAGATATFKHNLGRLPTHVEVLDNGAHYKGDCFFTARDSLNCTIQFEFQQFSPTSFTWVV